MYNLINSHIARIINTIDFATHIEPYVWLVRHFNEVNVASHAEFQHKYRRYWQLIAARLSENFCQTYFALLEGTKGTQNVNVNAIAQQLLQTPTHSDGRRALQFSFATKFAHMIDRRLPIYDSLIESFYFLPTGTANETVDVKLARLTASYDFLVAEHRRVLQEGLLAQAIDQFRQRFRVGPEYTDNKIIDSLIWRFVGFMRDGAVRNGEVVYG